MYAEGGRFELTVSLSPAHGYEEDHPTCPFQAAFDATPAVAAAAVAVASTPEAVASAPVTSTTVARDPRRSLVPQRPESAAQQAFSACVDGSGVLSCIVWRMLCQRLRFSARWCRELLLRLHF